MAGAGSITKRGEGSWRIKLELDSDPITKARRYHRSTTRGTKKEAQAELARIAHERDKGIATATTMLTVEAYAKDWLQTSAKKRAGTRTIERYAALIAHQVLPFLGKKVLAKLRPADIEAWHADLLARGGVGGRPLSPQTVGHAHRCLGKALADACRLEILGRNVVAMVRPPAVPAKEMAILDKTTLRTVLEAVRASPLAPAVAILISTGMRRAEMAGLQWRDLSFNDSTLRIERAAEKTRAGGLVLKAPKTAGSRRTITLSAFALEAFAARRRLVEDFRNQTTLKPIGPEEHIFGTLDGGGLRDPDRLTQDWIKLVKALGLPAVTLHSLRHSAASLLIHARHDPVVVARQLGHASPRTTLAVYAHMYDQSGGGTAATFDAALGD